MLFFTTQKYLHVYYANTGMVHVENTLFRLIHSDFSFIMNHRRLDMSLTRKINGITTKEMLFTYELMPRN